MRGKRSLTLARTGSPEGVRRVRVRNVLRQTGVVAGSGQRSSYPTMQVFRNFIEMSAAAEELDPQYFIQQANELLNVRFQLGLPACRSVDEVVEMVTRVAAAMIEVSWQLSVCSADSSCDLSISGYLPRKLLTLILSDELASALPDRTEPAYQQRVMRHFETLRVGGIPNLNSAGLTIEDAIAIRGGDGSSSFRDVLRRGLDRYQSHVGSGEDQQRAPGEFEDSMAEAARSLSKATSQTSLKERAKGSVVPAAVGVAMAATSTIAGQGLIGVGAGAVTTASSVVWNWWLGRRTSKDSQIASRYCAMLSSPRSAQTPACRWAHCGLEVPALASYLRVPGGSASVER